MGDMCGRDSSPTRGMCTQQSEGSDSTRCGNSSRSVGIQAGKESAWDGRGLA